jgi:hypothetical protein
MKGTLFSVDFVEESNGNPRFLEMNTDTVVYDSFLNNECDWSDFITLISGSNIDTVSVIYKPELHFNVVNHLSESLHASAPFVTTFTTHEEFLYDIYPTPIVDAANKFILRMAYDENAIVDSTYCKTDLNSLKLFYEYTASNECVPFYYSSSADGEINTLDYRINDTVIPDIVLKTIDPNTYEKISFVKVGTTDAESTGSAFDSVRILDFLNSVSESHMVQNYLISNESIDNDIVSTIRYYGIVYGTELDTIHLGEMRTQALFSLPTEAQFGGPGDVITEYRIDAKHHYEYSTSPLIKKIQRGTYETETVVLSDNTTIPITSLTTGSVLKSLDITTLPDESNVASANYLLWSHAGSTLPSGSAITSSTVIHVEANEMDRFLLAEISVSGSDAIYTAPNSPLLVYCSSSDEIKFKLIDYVDPADDYTIGTDNQLIPITDIKTLIMNENTGSFYDINVEPVDNYLIGDVSYFSGIFHNAKFQ